MSVDDGSSAARGRALIELVERDRERRIEELLRHAEAQARELRSGARSQARRRVSGAIAEARATLRDSLSRARAALETSRRQERQHQGAALLIRAWSVIEEQFRARWQDPQSRCRWLESACGMAQQVLRPGTWVVEHAPDMSAEDLRRLQQLCGAASTLQVSLRADTSLAAGLRFHARRAVLDASPQGLLARRADVRARLLHELTRSRQTDGERP